MCTAFNGDVLKRVVSLWNNDMSTQDKWDLLRNGFVASGFGRDNRRQPDWFRDNASTLQPLLLSHNALFARWIQSGSYRDRQRYVAMRRSVAQAVKKAKHI